MRALRGSVGVDAVLTWDRTRGIFEGSPSRAIKVVCANTAKRKLFKDKCVVVVAGCRRINCCTGV